MTDKMATPKHTVTTWAYQENSDAYTHIVRGPNNELIAQLAQDTSGKAEATARLIVLAVNNHESLVDIARTIVCICDEGPEHVRELACCEGSPLVDRCRELLEKLGRKAIEPAEPICQKTK